MIGSGLGILIRYPPIALFSKSSSFQNGCQCGVPVEIDGMTVTEKNLQKESCFDSAKEGKLCGNCTVSSCIRAIKSTIDALENEYHQKYEEIVWNIRATIGSLPKTMRYFEGPITYKEIPDNGKYPNMDPLTKRKIDTSIYIGYVSYYLKIAKGIPEVLCYSEDVKKVGKIEGMIKRDAAIKKMALAEYEILEKRAISESWISSYRWWAYDGNTYEGGDECCLKLAISWLETNLPKYEKQGNISVLIELFGKILEASHMVSPPPYSKLSCDKREGSCYSIKFKKWFFMSKPS